MTLQVFRTGDTPIEGSGETRCEESPSPRRAGCTSTQARGERRISVEIGDWPSGVYYAELRARGRRGSATRRFVLAPRRLGTHRVAVVMPTNTWAAYNRRDADGNGKGDTWYEDSERTHGRHRRGPSSTAASHRTSATTTCPSSAGWR